MYLEKPNINKKQTHLCARKLCKLQNIEKYTYVFMNYYLIYVNV